MDRKDLLKEAYRKIRELQSRLEREDARVRQAPVAVVGAGCRFPGGADSFEAFWRILRDRTDTVGGIPPERWDVERFFDPDPKRNGKMYARHGAFLSGIDRFDPAFFGLSPREAVKMDPQQRLLLEVVWEALENGGQASERLSGSATGVFVAMNGDDYAHLIGRNGFEAVDLYYGTGVARSVAAGRISYLFGLKGPSICIDTACSGSLVAVHLACQSLRVRECRMAVAGGVTLLIAPDGYIIGSNGRMLSPSGRCWTFDARADGYVRGEGCGIVVLKRLEDAVSDRDNILAVIRGTALNQDGRSGGMTAPSGIAQEEVIRMAIEAAGVSPADVGYVETHGTGTILGDPIEAIALGNVFGKHFSKASPLRIGSVKTNVGHLEAAAGVAGLLKTILAIEKEEIPANLHFSRPNPHIPWEKLPIEVVTRPDAWPKGGRRIAGVSSFGFSGTNAHVIVEAAPAFRQPADASERPFHLLAVSARNREAREALVELYIRHFEEHRELSPGNVCFTANGGRNHFDHRLAVIGKDLEGLREGLFDFRNRTANDCVFEGNVPGDPASGIAFLFTGEGSEHPGMGRLLYGTQPVFRKTIDYCGALLAPHLELPLLSLLFPAEGEPSGRLHRSEYAGAALFAFEISLASLWRSWGIRPSVVMGHGGGEFAAACAAGVFGIEDGLMLAAAAGGATGRGFEKIAAEARYAAPEVDFVSIRSGRLADAGEIASSDYWGRNVNPTARFEEALEALRGAGYRLYLEIGPHPALIEMAARFFSGDSIKAIPSLSRFENDWRCLLDALGVLYVRGVRIDWEAVEYGFVRRKTALPTYPFQRERCWVKLAERRPEPPEPNRLKHPLLHRRIRSPKLDGTVMESTLDLETLPYLKDHRIFKKIVVPAAAWLEMASAAAVEIYGGRSHRIESFDIHKPMIFRDGERPTVQIAVSASDGKTAGFEIFSAGEGADWRRHAAGRFAPDSEPFEKQTDGRPADSAPPESFDGAWYYELLAGFGVEFGPTFRGIARIDRIGRDIAAQIRIPDLLRKETGSYRMHPALLDAGIQALGMAIYRDHGRGDVFLPVGLESYRVFRPGEEPVVCRGGIHSVNGNETLGGNLRIYGRGDRLLAEIRGLRFKRAEKDALRRIGTSSVSDWLYRVEWEALGRPEPVAGADPDRGLWLILSEPGRLGRRLAGKIRTSGDAVHLIHSGNVYAELSADCSMIRSADPADLSRLLKRFGRVKGIVHLLGAGLCDPEPGLPPAAAFADHGWPSVLALAQALAEASPIAPPHLTIVTAGGVAAGTAPSSVRISQSPVWGLGRVIASELPELRCKMIDLDPCAPDDANTDALFAEVVGRNRTENQIALRHGERFGIRLTRGGTEAACARELEREPYQLEIEHRGVLDRLALRPAVVAPPGRGEVQIRIDATGLNFRDVLNALDRYPGDPGPLGNECAGTVSALGEGVDGLRVGDAVVAVTPRAFCTYVNAPADLVVRRPEGIGVEAAAGIPMAFLTADYALNRVGRMKAGDRVLVHAEAGGVGMAAVQLALRAGAEIYATAGGPEKREMLKSIGIRHVMSSRTLEFADRIMELTEGEGIDIVLNSLAGEFIPKSLSILRKGGRFLEIGKIDLRNDKEIARVHPDIVYTPIFLGDVCRSDPGLIRGMLEGILRDMREGRLSPLPHRAFPIREAAAAFRFMAQAKHTGKIVIDQRPASRQIGIRAGATYLITGGTGGLGLSFARWLVEKGARHLILFSRRPPGESAWSEIERLESEGAHIEVARGDVADAEDIRRILSLAAPDRPVKGIIHAAGRIEDSVLRNQTRERFAGVLHPKVTGSWLLHTLTVHMDLDFFVLCSAGAALFGSPGQGNYAAANAFMDALAWYRRTLDLPALSVNWGPWSGVGMAGALSEKDRDRWAAIGMGAIDPDCGAAALEKGLRLGFTQIAVLPVDWAVYRSRVPRGEVPPFLSGIVAGTGEQENPASKVDFLSKLGEAAPEERYAFVRAHVRKILIDVLELDTAAEIETGRGLSELGIDSLMAVEVSNRLKHSLGRPISSTIAFEYPTLDALAHHLAKDLLGLESVEGKADAKLSGVKPLRETPVLSEEDAEKALLRELEKGGY